MKLLPKPPPTPKTSLKFEMSKFSIGQNSLDVLKVIVGDNPSVLFVKIISHKVGKNWRQVNFNNKLKIKNLEEGFEHPNPIKEKIYSRKDFLKLELGHLESKNKEQVWSFVSEVRCKNGITCHIPMMNFHPEEVGMAEIVKAIKYICGKKRGCILDSGRFFHYYGNFLLNKNEWTKFLAQFLMACILVSPRYIGHRLHKGYCALRLTAQKDFKPKIPIVIKVL